MSCPTCDHTMQLQFMSAERQIFHCPRCGTMRSLLFDDVADTVPALVGRCRKFIGVIGATVANPELAAVHREWATLGIAEAINPPGDRP